MADRSWYSHLFKWKSMYASEYWLLVLLGVNNISRTNCYRDFSIQTYLTYNSVVLHSHTVRCFNEFDVSLLATLLYWSFQSNQIEYDFLNSIDCFWCSFAKFIYSLGNLILYKKKQTNNLSPSSVDAYGLILRFFPLWLKRVGECNGT